MEKFTDHLVIIAVIVVLTLSAGWIIIKAGRLFLVLKSINKDLQTKKPNLPPDEYGKIFSREKHLSHLWTEYRETLYTERKDVDGEEQRVIKASIPAEAVFNSNSVIDSQINTEFIKHVPGMLTGVGIIGTFYGLINGLSSFEVSENSVAVRNGLELLLQSVSGAFFISLTAIAVAMVVTFLEKLVVSWLYQQVDRTTHLLDAKYKSKASEDYLNEIRSFTEETSNQIKQLKLVMVNDFIPAIKNASELQHEDSVRTFTQLTGSLEAQSRTIADSIKEGLTGPVSQMVEAYQKNTGDQSESTVKMLGDVMSSFSERLNELFGSQIGSINSLNQQAAASMKEAVSDIAKLVENLQSGGSEVATSITEKAATAIELMELRQAEQAAMQQRMLEDFQKGMGTAQGNMVEAVSQLLDGMSQKIEQVVQRVGTNTDGVLQDTITKSGVQLNESAQATQQIVDAVSALTAEMSLVSDSVKQAVSSLSASTSNHIDKLNLGADKMSQSADKVVNAGDSVARVVDRTADVATSLFNASSTLEGVNETARSIISQAQTQQSTTTAALDTVNQLLETVKRDAQVSSEMIARIEASAAGLKESCLSIDDYLNGVNEVIQTANDSFREALVNTISQVNSAFTERLGNSVGMISSAVSELEETITTLNDLGRSK